MQELNYGLLAYTKHHGSRSQWIESDTTFSSDIGLRENLVEMFTARYLWRLSEENAGAGAVGVRVLVTFLLELLRVPADVIYLTEEGYIVCCKCM